jgi:large subunit ribosomal protein L10
MARPEKVAQVEAVKSAFDQSKSVVLVDFTGLDVANITELRRQCREAGVDFKVVKNTLAKRGIEGSEAEGLSGQFEGPTAIVAHPDAEHVGAKVIAEFAGEHEDRPAFKAGYVDGALLGLAEVVALSKLPSKEELLAQLLGGIQGPGNGLVACLQGPLRNLMSVLDQIKDQKS